MRRMWMFIGTGKNVHLDYFLPLSDPKNTDKTNSNATNQTQNMADNDQAREVVVEEMMEDGENRDQDKTEDVKMKLDSVLFKLQSILSDRIEHDPKGNKNHLAYLKNILIGC